MRYTYLLSVLLIFSSATGQVSYPVVAYVAVDPTGGCYPQYMTVNMSTGVLSGCVASLWVQLTGGSSQGKVQSGTCTFSSSACTASFTGIYHSAPICVATDQTSPAPVRASPSQSGCPGGGKQYCKLVLTGGTGSGASDIVAWTCSGN